MGWLHGWPVGKLVYCRVRFVVSWLNGSVSFGVIGEMVDLSVNWFVT